MREAASDESYKVTILKFAVFLQDLDGIVHEFFLARCDFERIRVDIVT